MNQRNNDSNPLLDLGELPQFSKIKAEHVTPAIDFLLQENRREVKKLEAICADATWETFVKPLEDLNENLSKTWSPVSHLNAVKDSPALREVYESCLPKLTAYEAELGQNEKLFLGFKTLQQGPEYTALKKAQQKVISNALRDFHLTGVDLPKAKQHRFKQVQQRLSVLMNQFERNVLDATRSWHLHIDREEDLSGLPTSALDMSRQMAQHNDQPGWRFTLDAPSYLSFMTYADNRTLRRSMYEAYVTRASDMGPDAGKFDNSEKIAEILRLRREKAELLGYQTYAEVSLVKKMAESPQQVLEFLQDLADRAKPVARRELDDVRHYAAEQLNITDLEPWDLPYCSEKLKQSLYQFSEEEVRPYFPAPTVLKGMFEVVHRLYGLRIERVTGVDVWNPHVEFYQIQDAAGQTRGRFYVDLYVRPHKRGGAWMDDFVSRKTDNGNLQIPVAFLTCNFSIPSKDKPALLTHDEVITLFHEFGHGLHHLLTTVDYVGVAGIHGVAWDAVEMPSQFMENWCWQSEALCLIAGHYKTETTLTDGLLQKMRDAKNFQSGLQLLRQLEFAMFDMRLHHDFTPDGRKSVQSLLHEVRDAIAVVFPPEYNRSENSFSHIFAGGYAAGYYSYKWAEVLSADAFSLFEERGIFHQDTGQSFMHNILETGGSVDALDAFIAFRGRQPRIDALLQHSGLEA